MKHMQLEWAFNGPHTNIRGTEHLCYIYRNDNAARQVVAENVTEEMARLIAAVPELLEACEAALDLRLLAYKINGAVAVVELLRAAINKATEGA